MYNLRQRGSRAIDVKSSSELATLTTDDARLGVDERVGGGRAEDEEEENHEEEVGEVGRDEGEMSSER